MRTSAAPIYGPIVAAVCTIGTDTGAALNPEHNEERYAPRLSAIALQPLQLDKDKESRADPRVALLELILEMRARDPGGQKALPPPKGNNGHGEIIDAVVAQVVEEDDEDHGDGEAA